MKIYVIFKSFSDIRNTFLILKILIFFVREAEKETTFSLTHSLKFSLFFLKKQSPHREKKHDCFAVTVHKRATANLRIFYA